MEVRLIIAYGLLALMGVAGGAWAIVSRRRRAARRLRMRGIKSYSERAR